MKHWIAFALLCGLFASVPAQIPDEFTNLQVLPENIDKQELVGVMRGFATSLGVRCNHCHPGGQGDSLEGVDFATDEKETKKVARAMMKMTREINGNLLPLAGRKDTMQVRCITCHRGLTSPETLETVLLRRIEEDGVDAAIGSFRELRDEHYGTGRYDFSAATLASVAETLARQKGDFDGAIAVMRLNVEVNPDTAYGHFMLGQLLLRKGDPEAAKASVQKAVDLEPDNSWYKRALEGMSK